jgi:hypothetical protein
MSLVKIFTHEAIVHSQIAAVERVLKREVDMKITLNVKESRSSIEFTADEKEIVTIKNDLGYVVMVYDGSVWLPHI